MSQLESMKYMSPEMLGQPAESAPATKAPAPVNAGSHRLATASDLGMAQWTIALTVVMCFMTLIGAWGAIGGVIELIGLMTIESNVELMKKLGSYGADTQFAMAVYEAQIDNRLFLYLVAGIRILIGVSFLWAVAMMKSKQTDANRFAALVCVGAFFYNMLVMLGAYLCVPSELPGLPPEAVSAMTAGVVIFAVVGLGFKLAMYGGLLAFLMNKNNRALFAPRPAKESFN